LEDENQSINQYPFIVWYDTSNIPADNNAFGIYITRMKRGLPECVIVSVNVPRNALPDSQTAV